MLRLHAFLALSVIAAGAGCASDPGGPGSLAPTVVSVAPAAGATGVGTTAPIVIGFSHAMLQGMETNVVLHQGTVTGPAVAGTWTWSGDRRTLTFVPSAPLEAATTWVLHLAPTLTSAMGEPLDHGACAGLGGQGVTSGMMGGGMPGGMMRDSMGPGMMGAGWRMAGGGYGMIFTFTTA